MIRPRPSSSRPRTFPILPLAALLLAAPGYAQQVDSILDTGAGSFNIGPSQFDANMTWLSAFAANDPIADMNNDADFNFFDVSDFLSDFATGCP